MATNYALRSPLYATTNYVSATLGQFKFRILTGTTVLYTIIKPASSGVDCFIEVAELLRDYLNITFDGTNYTPQKISFEIRNTPQTAAGVNLNSEGLALSGDGWEAYGLFTDGKNPELPFENRQKPTWLLPEKYPVTGTPNDDFFVYVPFDVGGTVAGISFGGVVSFFPFSDAATSIDPSTIGAKLTISRIGCTKYGTGRKITFINKYGVLQDLWFFLKAVKDISRTNESFQSNTLTSSANFSQTNAPTKLFNTRAKQKHTLSSGYYPEYMNAAFEELLLSEYVWYTRAEDDQPNSLETIPVIVKTSSIKYKTNLNDSLIEYVIEFEDAFDYINNIR